jgi:hypothetical protein
MTTPISHAENVTVGVVVRANDHGFVLEGDDLWLNVSRYAKPAPRLPKPGEYVRATLDGQGYVRTVDVLHDEERVPYQVDDGVDVPPPERQVGRSTIVDSAPPDRDVQIRRMNALSTATAILSSGGRACEPGDVLSLAAKLEAWVGR